MLYAVSCTLPLSCHSFAFLEWWRHLLATSSRYFFTTPTQISKVIRTRVGVWCLKCSTATVKVNVPWCLFSHCPAPEVKSSSLWRQHSGSGLHLHLLIKGLRGIVHRQSGQPLALSLQLNPLLAALTVALTTLCHCVRQYNTPCDLCRAPDSEGVLFSKGLLRFVVSIQNIKKIKQII